MRATKAVKPRKHQIPQILLPEVPLLYRVLPQRSRVLRPPALAQPLSVLPHQLVLGRRELSSCVGLSPRPHNPAQVRPEAMHNARAQDVRPLAPEATIAERVADTKETTVAVTNAMIVVALPHVAIASAAATPELWAAKAPVAPMCIMQVGNLPVEASVLGPVLAHVPMKEPQKAATKCASRGLPVELPVKRAAQAVLDPM